MKRFIILLLVGMVHVGLCRATGNQPIVETAVTSIQRDTLVAGADSIIVIETACAPICSSIVRTYNRRWETTGEIPSPFEQAVFPEAYIEDGTVKWQDNTSVMWDEEERKAPLINKE